MLRDQLRSRIRSLVAEVGKPLSALAAGGRAWKWGEAAPEPTLMHVYGSLLGSTAQVTPTASRYC